MHLKRYAGEFNASDADVSEVCTVAEIWLLHWQSL